MTRKHFIALARALALSRPLDPREYPPQQRRDLHAMRVQWIADRETLMGILATTNPLFDRERFIAATEACLTPVFA